MLIGRHSSFSGAPRRPLPSFPDEPPRSRLGRLLAYGFAGVCGLAVLAAGAMLVVGPPPQRPVASLPPRPAAPASAPRSATPTPAPAADATAAGTPAALKAVETQVDAETTLLAAMRDQAAQATGELAGLQSQLATARSGLSNLAQQQDAAKVALADLQRRQDAAKAALADLQRRQDAARVALAAPAPAPPPRPAVRPPPAAPATPDGAEDGALQRTLDRLRAPGPPSGADGAQQMSPAPAPLGQITDAEQAGPPGAESARPRIFLHYRTGSERGLQEATEVARVLLFSDFAYAATTGLPSGTTAPLIRYYYPADAGAAGRLAALLRGSGLDFQVSDGSAAASGVAPGTIEVWIPS
jgi:hypothetical protein